MNPAKVLMCKPEYFEVNYNGNEFMKNNLGGAVIVDKINALKQWNDLKKVYESLGYKIELIQPVKDLVDMVFTANQSLPFIDTNGNKKVMLSRMKNAQRKDEVRYFKDYYSDLNYEVIELPAELKTFESFEGMGDCLIDFERNILFGGYGYRTDEMVYDFIAKYTGLNIVKLKLINPVLYHLDTCFSILNRDTAVICVSDFDNDGIASIKKYFNNIILADETENLRYFVCNCHCPDGKNVIVQRGSSKFKDDIEKSGFNLIEIETGEFMKSGGSVFCMKVMIF